MTDREGVLVLGSINQDLILEVPRFPQPGESLLAQPAVYASGGKGANQAVAVSRLGEKTWFAGKVGEDAFGERLKQDLAESGVNTELLGVEPGGSSGLALILLAAGENSIVVSPGANGTVSLAEVDKVLPYFRQARLLLVQLEIPLESVAHAMRLAHEQGLSVVLDPGPAQSCPQEILGLADYLTPNQTEASLLSGIPVSDLNSASRAAEKLAGYGGQGVAVKMGGQGVFVREGQQESHIPAIPVKVRDSTAAGDAFCGGLAVGLLHGCSFLEAARFANLVGALTVTRLGAQPSLPTRQAVTAFAQEQQMEQVLPWKESQP